VFNLRQNGVALVKHILTLLLISAFSAVQPSGDCRADEFLVPVLGESFFLVAETPTLQVFQGQRHEAGYQYQAASADGFNVSCFVEKPSGDKKGHAACFEHYWPKMKRNPLIDQESVKISKQENFVRVSYEYTASLPRAPKHHVNFYIEKSGRWLDIHISMLPDLPRDKVIKAFEESLKILPNASLQANRDNDKSTVSDKSTGSDN
jgi:hypothetical protein